MVGEGSINCRGSPGRGGGHHFQYSSAASIIQHLGLKVALHNDFNEYPQYNQRDDFSELLILKIQRNAPVEIHLQGHFLFFKLSYSALLTPTLISGVSNAFMKVIR